MLQTTLPCVIISTMSFYTAILRPLLFRMNPESAHYLTVEACSIAGRIPLVPRFAKSCLNYSAPELKTEVGGLRFGNPIGLAAGWDKSGRALRMLDHLGFGFAEIGSISARLSHGNPKPRLFRLPNDRAIIVNYGLPNDGAEVVAGRLESYRSQVPLGLNIVKTNDGPDAPTSSHDAILADYERSVELLWPYASYLTLSTQEIRFGFGGELCIHRPRAIRMRSLNSFSVNAEDGSALYSAQRRSSSAWCAAESSVPASLGSRSQIACTTRI